MLLPKKIVKKRRTAAIRCGMRQGLLIYGEFEYQAALRDKPSRVVAKGRHPVD